jgi:hypothetical protein
LLEGGIHLLDVPEQFRRPRGCHLGHLLDGVYPLAQ